MIVFTELFTGRTETGGAKRSARIPYMAQSLVGDVEESLVLQYAFAQLPSFYDTTLYLASVEVEEHINPVTWRIAANYEEQLPSFSGSTGGGTQHITNSIATRGRYGPPDPQHPGQTITPPDFKGAIGYDGQNVSGVDIQVPVYNFSETHYFLDPVVTPAYKATLFRLTGTVNTDPFRGFNPGEVLFLGADWNKRGRDLWEVLYRFASLPNQTNIVIGDINVAEKKGWDYLWILYDDAVDDTAKGLIKIPIAAYVEKVYQEKSFADLGLG